MVIGRGLYSQTYYYNTKTNEVTAKDGGSEALVDYLNGKSGAGSTSTLGGSDQEQKTLIEAFLEMQDRGMGNSWDRFKPVDGEKDIYEFTYTKKNDLESAITIGGMDVFQQKAAFILPGAASGKWDYEYPEKAVYNRKTNSATITPGDTFTLKNGCKIKIGRYGAEVSKDSYANGTEEDIMYAQKMAELMTDFIKTANRGCLGLSVSVMSEEQVQELSDIIGQTGIDTTKKFSVNGTSFMERNNKISIVGAFAEGSKVWERESDWRHEALKKLLYDEFGVTEVQLEKEVSSFSPIPDKASGAPYSYLANESGIIEYNGVEFYCNNTKRELCLGDMSNPADVICIPMSQGGTLKVNRNNIDQLSKAIGMFSPEDVNRILRAIKLDGKVQQMELEIEEMENGIGKDTRANNVDNAADAELEKEEADGFLGYENEAEEGAFTLTDSQLDILTSDIEEYLKNKDKIKS